MIHRQLRILILALTGTSLAVAPIWWASGQTNDAAARTAAAAIAFVDTLDPSQRTKAMLEFSDPERIDWQFVPGRYPGLETGAMTVAQRRAAHGLLRSVLSTAGYLRTTSIMALESVLHSLESNERNPASHRDPERYALAIFGDPATDEPWGWRLQGHHLSLNFTSVDGVVVSRPSFLGANPAEVRSGPQTGLRVLGASEDLARQLLESLTDQQRVNATIAVEAPRDVILGPGVGLDRLAEPRGIAWPQLDESQRTCLWSLVEEFARDLRSDLAEQELGSIRDAGRNHLHFAWAGSIQRGEPHYFRIQGAAFAIEYDNTQNGANHVHTVWHDLQDDFAADRLRQHYAEHQHPHPVPSELEADRHQPKDGKIEPATGKR